MPSNMFTGDSITKAAKGKKRILPTQTGAQAKKNIIKKYGSIAKTGKYYHRGNGDWAKYSAARDAGHKLKKPYQVGPKYKATNKAHKGDSNRRLRGKGRL